MVVSYSFFSFIFLSRCSRIRGRTVGDREIDEGITGVSQRIDQGLQEVLWVQSMDLRVAKQVQNRKKTVVWSLAFYPLSGIRVYLGETTQF